MGRLRVLWVVDGVDYSTGSFTGLIDILRRVDREQFDLHAVSPRPGLCSRALEDVGVPVHWRPLVPSGKTLAYANAVASFRRLLRREHVSLVYFPDHARWRPAELLAARWAGVPAVLHLRSPPDDVSAADPSLRSARAIIGNSAATLRPLRGRVPDAALHVIHNGFDFDRFGPGTNHRGAFFRRDLPIVGFVGMFRPEKGIEQFLAMAARLRAERPAVRFLAVGDESPPTHRDWLAKMRSRAAALGIADAVCFTGLRHDIPELMRTIDVLVVPSMREGFGRVIVEANAVGTPVVGHDSWGIPEVIEDGVTGVLVPVGDLEAMARAVGRILDDDAWRARVAELAPARVRARFSLPAQVRAIETVWRRAAER